MQAVKVMSILGAVSLAACSGKTAPAPDLPAGWGDARSVAQFSQAACGGSADDPAAPAESVEITAQTRGVSVAYHDAHFRCEQDVEAFVRSSSGTLDFLVQPVDMNPSTVVRCDCLYEIAFAEPAETGSVIVTVYRRWDHYGGNPVDPTEVGSATVTVP
jgi:hypothetical protein